jgi:hypothetical protein
LAEGSFMKIRNAMIGPAVVTVLAAALTAFYFIHEDLPKPVRAPTSLILAPVAIVDGACYALGIPGIYGKAIPVFVVNAVTAGVAFWAAMRFVRWWQQRRRMRAEPEVGRDRGNQ